MKLKDFVDKGEQTKEGEKLVLFYNKTLGCKCCENSHESSIGSFHVPY